MAKLAKVEDVVADIRIDKNDLLTVAVSKAEVMMHNRLAEAQKLAKAQEKELKDLRERLSSSLERTVKEHYSEAVEHFKSAAKLLGDVDKLSISYGHTTIQEGGDTLINATLNLKYCGQWYGFDFGAKLKLTAVQKGVISDISVLTSSLKNTQEEIIGWRKRLANLPTIERQFKARLVESQLSTTEEGMKLLASLDLDNFEQMVLALPGM